MSADLAGKADWEVLPENQELGEAVDSEPITQNSKRPSS
jgi:hypothetical protein